MSYEEWQWAREIVWCADLMLMFKRWCELRDLDPSWFDDLRARREWVRMNVWLGDAQSHNIIIARKTGTQARIEGGDDDG